MALTGSGVSLKFLLIHVKQRWNFLLHQQVFNEKKCFMANFTFKYYNSKKVVKLQGVTELYQSFSQETNKKQGH